MIVSVCFYKYYSSTAVYNYRIMLTLTLFKMSTPSGTAVADMICTLLMLCLILNMFPVLSTLPDPRYQLPFYLRLLKFNVFLITFSRYLTPKS